MPLAATRALPTRRERNRLRTRDALAAAALRLATAHGFERVTIEQIAAEADVSRRTFFRYYASKEAALFPQYGRRLARFRAELAAATVEGEAPLAVVERAFATMAALYMRERGEIVAQQRVIEGSPSLIAFERLLDRDWERAVAEALAAGPTRRDTSAQRRARVLAGAIMGAVRATLREWFDGGGRADLRAMARATFAQLATVGGRAHGAGRRRR